MRLFLLVFSLLILASPSVRAEEAKKCINGLGVGGTFRTDKLGGGKLKWLWFDYFDDSFSSAVHYADELAMAKGYSLALVKTYYRTTFDGRSVCQKALYCGERSCYTKGRPAVDVLLADGDGKMLLLEKNSQDKELIAKLTGFMETAGFKSSKGRWWHFEYIKPLP